MAWGRVPLREIRERQGRWLHRFLARKVYRYSPHYRRLFDENGLNPDMFRTVDDLKKLPFTSKEDLLPTEERSDKFRDFVLQPTPEQLKEDLSITDKVSLFARSKVRNRPIREQLLDEYLPVLPIFTTGRSTNPVAFVYTKNDIDMLRTAGQRLFQVADLSRTHDRGLNAFPYAPHLGFYQVQFAGEAAGVFILHSGGGKTLGTQKILSMAEKGKPTFLMGTPGYIMHLCQQALEQGVKVASLRRVILGAERTSQAYKEKLKQILAEIGSQDVKVYTTYGFTEARKAWLESADAEDSRFLLYPDMDIIEIIDPETGENVPEGAPGEIVITNISGSGSIVLRYRTGDLAEDGIIYDRCKYTGLLLPQLSTRISRVSEIKKVKGTLVDFNELFGYFNSLKDVVEWQVEVKKPDDDEFGKDLIYVRLTVADGVDRESFEKGLREQFTALTETGIDKVEFMPRAELAELLGLDTRPKEARIVDSRPAD